MTPGQALFAAVAAFILGFGADQLRAWVSRRNR